MDTATMALPGMDDPTLYDQAERMARSDRILGVFDAEFRTESAFYLAFNRLSANDRDYLAGMMGTRDEWTAFSRLCRKYRVKEA